MANRLLAAVALSLACSFAAAQSTEKSIDLNEPTLYEFLLGEIALQRGDLELAAKTYLELAKRTRDPRVARRAVEVANQARLPELAQEAAQTWYELEPSLQALQVLVATLVAARKIDQAEPYLEKLLSSEGVNLENGLMQLNRLLAGNPDKASNLRVISKIAARYPTLAQSHFAVAQAAAVAGEDKQAIAAARRALAIRPDWEFAALLEAQVLQKNAPTEATKRLGEFVEKNPNSREARLAYARALVARTSGQNRPARRVRGCMPELRSR